MMEQRLFVARDPAIFCKYWADLARYACVSDAALHTAAAAGSTPFVVALSFQAHRRSMSLPSTGGQAGGDGNQPKLTVR
jgi:hypothetical protein